jgi:hypothetical protein
MTAKSNVNVPSTIPDHIEQQNDKRPTATRVVAARFRQVAVELDPAAPALAHQFGEVAWRLVRCAQSGRNRGAHRCGHNFCPRCARQRAIGDNKELTKRLYERSDAGLAPHGFAMLTLSMVAANARTGVRQFKTAWQKFFRRRPFRRAFTAGELHLQPQTARGDASGQNWNIHAHALVELACSLVEVGLTDLQTAWAEIIGGHGRSGSLDLRQDDNLKLEYFTHGNLADTSRRHLRHAKKAQ